MFRITRDELSLSFLWFWLSPCPPRLAAGRLPTAARVLDGLKFVAAQAAVRPAANLGYLDMIAALLFVRMITRKCIVASVWHTHGTVIHL